MKQGELRLSVVERCAERVVVAMAGELDIATAPALRAGLLELVDAGCSQLTIDVAELEFCDCVGLHVLLAAANRLREQGGHLRLCGPTEQLRRLLGLTGLAERLLAGSAAADRSH